MITKTKIWGLAGLLCAGISLQASTTTYDFTTQALTPGSANSGGSLSMGSGPLTVTETAWWVNANNSGATVTGATNDFARTWLGAYSGYGLGVCNPNEQTACLPPQHQIDNYSGLDFVLMGFNAAVSLQDLKVASFGNPTGTGSDDVDMSYAILSSSQYTALQAGTLAFNTVTFTTLTSADLSSDTYTLSGTGQYILFGAAVTAYYGDTSSTATPDAFKIQDLTFSPTATPEPATFGLFGSALLFGAMVARRRRASK